MTGKYVPVHMYRHVCEHNKTKIHSQFLVTDSVHRIVQHVKLLPFQAMTRCIGPTWEFFSNRQAGNNMSRINSKILNVYKFYYKTLF